jgi:MFS superfamily sulfate permease-like transporter
MSFFILAGVLTICSFIFLTYKFGGWETIQKIIGLDRFVDISSHVVIIAVFGLSMTISGLMIGISAGMFLSACLFLSRKLLPHQKRIKLKDGTTKWMEVPGEWRLGGVSSEARKRPLGTRPG